MIMREYYIYMQRTKVIEYHCEWVRYKWLPWEYLGYLTGTKEVYIYFKRKYDKQFYNKFNYFEDEYIYDRCDFMMTKEYHRYLIIDDHGNVRNFRELTDQYKKKRPATWIYSHRGGGWNEHWVKLTSDQRKSITPEEIRNIKDEYGISFKPIKPKRRIDSWDYKCNKISGWKMQSKRRKQWKTKVKK